MKNLCFDKNEQLMSKNLRRRNIFLASMIVEELSTGTSEEPGKSIRKL